MFSNRMKRNVFVLGTGIVLATIQVPANAEPSWTLRTTDGPGPRNNHALAYDGTRGVTVLFGGHADAGGLGDTWEWDGNAWVQRFPTTSPPPRWACRMVYDSVRDVSVLFGGWNGRLFGDTWEWDGSTWTQRFPEISPSPKNMHGMAFDSARGVTVLFGGWPYSSETWEWDGDTWIVRATTGPHPRQIHSLVYDTARGVTVLFGGFFYGGSNTLYGDTWEWDGSTWTPRFPEISPSPRENNAMAYDSARGVSVLFGGSTVPVGSGISDETWEWDGSTWTQRFLESSPSPRTVSAMAYDSARGATVLFGGYNSGNRGDTWEYASANQPPICDAGGFYTAECEGMATSIMLDGMGSSDPDDDPLNFTWTADCPGGFLDDPTSATPILTVDTSDACDVTCAVSLTVDDGNGDTSECTATVTIEDTTPPVVTCSATPVSHGANGRGARELLIEYSAWDECSEVTGSAVIETRCCPLPVVDGQVVKMKCRDHEQCKLDIDFERGTLQIKTDEAALVVTATDQCGNEATCTVELCVPGDDG